MPASKNIESLNEIITVNIVFDIATVAQLCVFSFEGGNMQNSAEWIEEWNINFLLMDESKVIGIIGRPIETASANCAVN